MSSLIYGLCFLYVVYHETRVWATEKNIIYKSQVGCNDYDIKRSMTCAVRDDYRDSNRKNKTATVVVVRGARRDDDCTV